MTLNLVTFSQAGRPLYVNPERVDAIYKDIKSSDIVVVVSGMSYHVDETMDEVREQLVRRLV
jgi:uncharacterized protein YlzI (FlbEa/FlbD family)